MSLHANPRLWGHVSTRSNSPPKRQSPSPRPSTFSCTQVICPTSLYQTDYEAALDDYIAVTFTVSPAVRGIRSILAALIAILGLLALASMISRE
jgi:hypothetical protein